MAQRAKQDKGPESSSVIEQHMAGEIVWLGFRRHGDGKFTRFQAITKDGRFVAVDSERNEGLASFARDFRAQVAKALIFTINPLRRR
jgi:hypothetical protein